VNEGEFVCLGRVGMAVKNMFLNGRFPDEWRWCWHGVGELDEEEDDDPSGITGR
jgi:hypothetical protein